MNWKDVGVRALKTAVQTGLALLTADALFGGFNPDLLEQAGVAAASAAYSVLNNALLQWASK